MDITYAELNQKLAEKQKALSLKRLERPALRAAYQTSKRSAKAEYKRVWLLIKLEQPSITTAELKVLVEGGDEYGKVWAEEIQKQASYEKVNIEISNLEDELDTLREIGNNLSRENRAAGVGI